MAFINPCEKCKDPQLMELVSNEVEATVLKLQEDETQRLELVESGEVSDPLRDRMIGVLTNTSTFLADAQALTERANARPCDPGEEGCSRAHFVMEAFEAAANNAVTGIHQVRGDEPPQPPATE